MFAMASSNLSIPAPPGPLMPELFNHMEYSHGME
jgi:hypothetical protein